MSSSTAPKQNTGDPGAELRAARQRKQVEPRDIARRLRLEEAVIAAIEEERFDELPPHAYVRGYVRAYARLVGLDADDITARFDAADNDRMESPAILPRRSRPPFRQVAQRRSGLLFSGVVVVMLLAAAIALWIAWRSYDWSFMTTGDETEPPALPEARVVEVENPAAPVPGPGEPEAAAGALDGEPASAAGEPAGVVDEASTTTNAEVQAGEPEPSAAVGEDEEEEAALVDMLTFRFNEDSWVEVQDATGEGIFMDVGRAGQSSTITGKAPFSILVGYAPGVKVVYNGDPVALEPHTRQNVARLVVGH